MHVHLREPGYSAKETIATGTAAAARGGFTSMVCMPNTSPSIDNAGTVALIHERATQQAAVNVYVAGAITKNIAGEELAPIGSLKQAGVVAITDDGRTRGTPEASPSLRLRFRAPSVVTRPLPRAERVDLCSPAREDLVGLWQREADP